MNTLRPSYPLVTVNADFTQGPPNVPGVSAMSLDSPTRRTTVRAMNVQRGRQYELDQVQAGTADLTITDPLEMLHPGNVAAGTNVVSNGFFANGLTGWSGHNAATISLGQGGQSDVPTCIVQSTTNATTTGALSATSTGVIGGGSYTVAADVLALSPVTVGLGVNWFTNTGTFISTSFVGAGAWATASWKTFSANVTAPATAARAQVFVDGGNLATGSQFMVDNVVLYVAGTTKPVPGSPFNTGGNTITSYRCMQVGAWWNSATGDLSGNLLNTANTPAGSTSPWDPSFELGVASSATPVGVTATAVSSPPDGSLPVTQVVAPNTTGMMLYGMRLVPGTTYQMVADVFATTGVTVAMGTYLDGVTTPGSTTTITGAYQPISVSFTAVAGQSLYFAVTAATGGFPATFFIAGIRCVGLSPGWTLGGSATMRVTTTLVGGAHSGIYALSCGVSSGADTATVQVPTAPGVVYTMSAWLNAQGGGSVGRMTIGAASVSTSTVNAWQRLSLTFTATDALTAVTITAPAGTYPVSVYIDDIQLEVADTASAFTTTGPVFYPIYTGYIERYPLKWDMAGTRGIRPLTCVDALSILSRAQITQSYRATILADKPAVYIPYDDQSMPQAVQLPMGGAPFLGYQNLGTQATVNFQGDTFLDGTSVVSVSQPNSDPPTFGDPSQITYLGTRGGTLMMNPQAFTIEVWAKIDAGEPYFGAGSVPFDEPINVEPFGPAFGIGWVTFLGGVLGWTYQDPNGNSVDGPLPGPFSGFPDGQWHYFAIKLFGGNRLTAVVDDVVGGVATISPSTAVALNNFYVDAQAYFGDPVTTIAVANLACYPYALSNGQMLEHFNRGNGFLNEVSGARVNRILSQYWGGLAKVAPGMRKMAPDNASGGNDYNTRFMLDVLQEIQETERGLIYTNAAGVVVFEDSTSRYVNNAGGSRWVFGENPAGASPVEYPYEDLQEDFDPTYTFSQTNLTRPGNQDFAPLPNPLPTNPPYGQRVLTQEVGVNDDFDLVQASTFYLKRYGSPAIRVDTLTLNPAANPALWPVVLSLEISQRITVKRRTSAGLVTTADYYIEQISHAINGDDGSWTVQLQCSPVFNDSAWILGDPTLGVLGSTTIPVY